LKVIQQSHEILRMTPGPLRLIEEAGRTCYKSAEGKKITNHSAQAFVKQLLKMGHLSVLEHSSMTVRFITNRGVSHELVRHRLASFSQESTRYVDYKDDIEFIDPAWPPENKAAEQVWWAAMESAELAYRELREKGWRPEQAREVLPNSLKTEIVMTANFREWLHVFDLRCDKAAHPQMRALMCGLRDEFLEKFEVFKSE